MTELPGHPGHPGHQGQAAHGEHAGRVVLVTGGTRGIGAAIAAAFARAGASVVVCARRPPEDSTATGGTVFVPADIRDPEQQSRLVDTMVERFGRLDVLVNNAGGTPLADAASASSRYTQAIMTLNLVAPFQLAVLANTVMQRQPQGGQIISVGSVAADQPAPGSAAYSAAKAGLAGMTRALAMEFAPAVRVNEVTVGLVLTELSEQHYGGAAGLAAIADGIPLGRMATPEDVARACLLLASDGAAYVTGARLLVHGGGEVPPRAQAVRRADGA